MTVDGSLLLKMLEPALRPDVGGGVSSPGRLPVEAQSFEQLLTGQLRSEATQADDAGDEVNPSEGKKHGGPLGQLARVDLLENSSLRQLIAGRQEVNQHD